MNRIIIACGTLEDTLTVAMKSCNCQLPVIWLEAGAHNVPKRRRDEIEEALARCDGYDTVLLCMSLCGNSLVGLASGTHTLVLPCFDDCITLLLGDLPREADAYYLSSGWLAGKDNLIAEYERTVQKYGPTRAHRIFCAMLSHYRKLVWIGDPTSLPDSVRAFALRFGLELKIVTGSITQLERLLADNWDDCFLIIPPHEKITMEMRKERISRV